jgi:phosphoribosylaminoimidazole carboxylase PurE protein
MDGQPVVGILVGNSNHLPLMQQTGAILERFGVPFELQVMSPHRSPDLVDEYSRTAESRGILAIICGAAGSGAGGLAGAVAARTALPVIGVPIASETLGGADALYSAVQMPRGVPVGTMAVNGAVNAAVYAAQIVGVGNPEVRARLHEFKESLDEGMRA